MYVRSKGFTLVELLAVPNVMSIIEDAKKGTLESTAKMIASGAEKQKVQNTVLDNDEEITCDSVAKINKGDYASCSITFDGNTAKVTIEGSGKFDGLNVCEGTKTNAVAIGESCTPAAKTLVAHIQELLKDEETLNNGLHNPKVMYNEVEYDTGIRYSGSSSKIKNKVYYNCEDSDSEGVSYGKDNYDYASSCEAWRIIGVFDVDDGTGNIEKRVKLINTASSFEASWDSSASDVNGGFGINQWGESTYENGNAYEGADLMRLLNGYYIGAENSTCTYCDDWKQETCSQTCTTESLKNANMKVLTNTAKSMIENALWYTYAIDKSTAQTFNNIYLQEKGISEQYTGKSNCDEGNTFCTDDVIRTTSWTGLVGLPYASELEQWITDWNTYPSSINPSTNRFSDITTWGYRYFCTKEGINSASASGNAYFSDCADDSGNDLVLFHSVHPSVYLKPEIKVISGNGDDKPYILGL